MSLVARVAVREVTRLSPSFVRVELAGPDLVDFGVDGPTYDQRIKLIFPGASGVLPRLGAQTWWPDFCALPEGERGSIRTYTIRAVRGSGAETVLVVDFVLHPDAHGPGSSWAQAAVAGDEVLAVVPRRGASGAGIEWAPGGSERLLLVGDETAVPAVCSILASLPGDARGAAFLEVPDAADVQRVDAPAGVSVSWLARAGAPVGSLITGAVTRYLGLRDEPTAAVEQIEENLWETPRFSSSGQAAGEGVSPADGRYAWIAGEAGMVTTLRRHLVHGLGLARSQVAFMGYWRLGIPMRS